MTIKKEEFILTRKCLADFLNDSRIGSYRFRIGNYRVIFDIKEDQIIILRVGHRGRIYRNI